MEYKILNLRYIHHGNARSNARHWRKFHGQQ
jgi:hypothetical protein